MALRRKKQRNFRTKNAVPTYLYLIILSIIIIYPVLITVSSAFQTSDVTSFLLRFSTNWTLDNFGRLFRETLYGTWYKNTIIIAFWTTVIQTFVITLAGYVYSRFKFVGKKGSLIFFLIIQMVPTMAALTAFYVMANLLNALDQYWFLTVLYIGGGIPMSTWLMKGYFDTVPYDLDESAKLDGAGNFRIFWQIVLPLVKPMIAVQALKSFMGPFGDYLMSKFLLRNDVHYTVAVGLQTFISDPKSQEVVLFAAGSILIAVPICILFFYLQKYFVKGLVSGGTKG
ncbi:sugar ABC transporter permease [Lapidilactobacillus wuchangensis]|uniref:sugar ABC transporter permease n=1 Tax=Lapidilactobacillus wuchangensis TaxID=2486001 RepID=UPI000F7AE486|nr:sugar ABC transporter permease [Lapidilactobacillus wuchangensis]